MAMSYWPPVRKRPAAVQRDFRGVNKLDPFNIPDGFATSVKNRTLDTNGQHVTRDGFTAVGGALGETAGVGVWKDTELHVIAGGEWRKYNGSTWDSALTTGLGNYAASFCNFKGNFDDVNLIMANGNAIKRYDGTTVQDLAGVPYGGNFVTTYENRIWLALGNELRASSLDNAAEWNVFTDDSKSFGKDMESNMGETINALSGGLSKLVIGFPNAIHELYGGVPSDFMTKQLVEGIGPLNNRCLLTINGIMYILHNTGLYQYAGGVMPNKSFSQPVQAYFDRMNQAASATCALGSDGERLFVAIPSSTSSAPAVTLEYHLTNKTWFVWEGVNPRYFSNLNNKLYIAEGSRVITPGGTDDVGVGIEWEWVSKPFTAPSMAQAVRWLRMWVTTTLPTSSGMSVYLSKSPSGDGDWELVGGVPGSPSIQQRPIYIASSKVTNAKQIRFKISGYGPCTIHEVSWEQDTLPLR